MSDRAMFSRRDFLALTAGAGLAALACDKGVYAAPSGEIRTGKILSPDKKLNVACIGCGGKGSSDIDAIAGENIVALCDVDLEKAGPMFRRFPNAKRYKDYRRMLIEMDDQIDAVTVSTPDHMHFPASIMAILMGKHVFCQKPLTHTIWEARTIAAAARRHKVVTQMGIQGHCNPGLRRLKEWLDAEMIGPVREVYYWTNRPIWPQGIPKPTDTPPAPDTLDWNLWLGTAGGRPYNPAYVPFKWRGWWDFGCGALGDIGCHAMDAAFWTLNLGSPTSVEAEVSDRNPDSAPKWSIVTYQFPARGKHPPVKVVWHDGNKQPPRPKELEADRQLPGGIGGQLLVGEKGTIMVNDSYCSSWRVIPEARMQELAKNAPAKTLPDSPGVMNEFIRACKGEPLPGANFDYAGPLTEMVLLGNLAVRTGKKIQWDTASLKSQDAEANKLIRHPYRVF